MVYTLYTPSVSRLVGLGGFIIGRHHCNQSVIFSRCDSSGNADICYSSTISDFTFHVLCFLPSYHIVGVLLEMWPNSAIFYFRTKNVIFSVGHTDVSQAMRLSSVWPIDLQYHSQATATGYSCVGYVKTVAHFMVGQQFKHLQKQKVVF